MIKNLKVVIMAGGKGERLWPYSRPNLPKQFSPIITQQPMIIDTISRFDSFIAQENIYISSSLKHKSILKKTVPQITPQNIIFEPIQKDTACAILLALLSIPATDDEIFLFTPADHFVKKNNLFKKDILKAHSLTQNTSQMTLIGINPNYPSDCYGYIKINSDKTRQNTFTIDRFIEKPSVGVAKKYLKSRQFLWNSGLFMFKKQHLLTLFKKYMPKDFLLVQKYLDLRRKNLHSPKAIKIFQQINRISFDYAIVEKLKNINCIKASFDWDDVGNWEAFFRIKKNDLNGNVLSEQVKTFNTSSTLCQSGKEGKKKIILNGVNDLIVIETKDILYIAHRNEAIKIKEITSKL